MTPHILNMKIYRKWVIYCAAGELLGIGCAAGVAVLLNTYMGEPVALFQKVVVLCTMAAAGALEGTITGYLQWRVLKTILPKLSIQAWVSATVAVAAIYWVLGMLPSNLMAGMYTDAAPQAEMPAWVLPTAAIAFFIGGCGFGTAQWLVLRKHAANSAHWVWSNGIGWTLGLAIMFAAATWPDSTTPIWQIVVSGLVGGGLGGLAVGWVTGYSVLRLRPIE